MFRGVVFVFLASAAARTGAYPANASTVLAEFDFGEHRWGASTTSSSPVPVIRTAGTHTEVLATMAAMVDVTENHGIQCATQAYPQFGSGGLREIQSYYFDEELECMISNEWLNVVMCRSSECEFACAFYHLT